MSACTANAASPISLAVAATDSPFMSTHVTRAPSSANRIALALPMPDPAPVTIVTLPSRRPLMGPPPLVADAGASADASQCLRRILLHAAGQTHRCTLSAVSYTHLTLPTNREV